MVQKNSKEVNARHKKILDDLVKVEENKECADCNAKGPLWASINIGVFLCIKCAGCHRKLGTHISKVRSVNLDEWEPGQIKVIQEKGNGKVNALYEARLKQSIKPDANTDDRAREEFIKAKYERREFFSESGNSGKIVVEQVEEEEQPKKIEPKKEEVKKERKVPVEKKKPEPIRQPTKMDSKPQLINFERDDKVSMDDLFKSSTPTTKPTQNLHMNFHERSQSAPVSPQKNVSQQQMFENTITHKDLLGLTPDISTKKDSILSLFDEQPKKQFNQPMMNQPMGQPMNQQMMGGQRFGNMPPLGGGPQTYQMNQMNQNRPMMVNNQFNQQPKPNGNLKF